MSPLHGAWLPRDVSTVPLIIHDLDVTTKAVDVTFGLKSAAGKEYVITYKTVEESRKSCSLPQVPTVPNRGCAWLSYLLVVSFAVAPGTRHKH